MQVLPNPSVPKQNILPAFSLTFILILALAIMFGVVVGIGIMRQIIENRTLPLEEETLPISRTLLNNKMINQWRGSFTGTLVSKTDTTYQIRDDAGNILNLTSITPSGEKWDVIFMNESDETNRMFKPSEVSTNIKVRGEFWISPGGSDKPIAGMFTILK